ncbi:MAG TPA: hypothetical protein RMH99_11890 [Sandaracinaceae bacterium LLY-WYZ-13_1]|nr:hypothetical protein [Sandaracinaceae bacterium LLY-WYZ-13_1]
MPRLLVTAGLTWLLLCASASAQATGPSTEPSTEPSTSGWSAAPAGEEPAPGEPIAADAERERPDYDGRGLPPRDPADDVLWIPRIVFAPFYVISEFVLRRPLGWLVTEIERSGLFDEFFDFFTWEDRTAGLVPTAFFDFGFLPSVGLYFWWNDLGVEGHQLRINLGFWGPDWLHARALDRLALADGVELSFEVEGMRRPDHLWHGGGWAARPEARSRYGRSELQGGAQLAIEPWRASRIQYRAGVSYNEFDNSAFNADGDGDLPIESAVAQGLFDAPPSYTNGYVALTNRLDATFDTREERPAPGHGVRLQGWLGHGVDLQAPDRSSWIRYGGRLGLFVDVGDQRVVSLSGYVDFADALSDREVPFTEQVVLSRDPLLMGGFLPGYLVGRSATVLSFEYAWPIWVFIEGTLHASLGNVFGSRLEDFDVERLRMSFGFGFRTIGDRDNSARITIALGTEPFVRGANVSSVRFVVGASSF